jgi:hypothetical protein
MLDRLSDDEVSRPILGVFGYRRAAYFSAMIFSTYATAISSAVRDGDFQRELNKAVANNWITIDLRNRYRYQLTATGYAVRRMIDPALGQATNFVRP